MGHRINELTAYKTTKTTYRYILISFLLLCVLSTILSRQKKKFQFLCMRLFILVLWHLLTFVLERWQCYNHFIGRCHHCMLWCLLYFEYLYKYTRKMYLSNIKPHSNILVTEMNLWNNRILLFNLKWFKVGIVDWNGVQLSKFGLCIPINYSIVHWGHKYVRVFAFAYQKISQDNNKKI